MFHVGNRCSTSEPLDHVEIRLPDDFAAIDAAVGLSNESSCLFPKSFLAHGLGGDEGFSELLRRGLRALADFVVEDFLFNPLWLGEGIRAAEILAGRNPFILRIGFMLDIDRSGTGLVLRDIFRSFESLL